VVARAIVSEGQAWLDLRHRGAGFVAARFPRIHSTCLRYGLDLDAAPAPVYPAAHYAMGGVRTDLDGRTSLTGLYAAGEAASNGLHGANRLASNSLLEGVVYGARAARAMLRDGVPLAPAGAPPRVLVPELATDAVRELAWRYCGIERSGPGLESAVKTLTEAAQRATTALDRAAAERRNVHAVVLLIARCALARRECRGAHYRIDYPGIRSPIAKHSVISQDLTEVRFQ
jgi:L-aspartate oxidase